MTGGNGRLGAAGPLWAEEFRKQGPCRFGRSAAVEGGITGVEPGSAKEGRAGISQHSCWPIDAPALDDLPRAGAAATGRPRLRLLYGDLDRGARSARQFRGGYRFAALRTRSGAYPG